MKKLRAQAFGPGIAITGKRHEAVASVIRARIVEGLWPESYQLPSFDSLAEEFSVSNITIRQALTTLEGEGLVQRRQGVGTFVSSVGFTRRNLLLNFATSWGPIVETGDHVELRTLQSQVRERPLLLGADAAIASPAPAYWYFRRLQSDSGKAFSIVQAEIDLRLYDRARASFEKERAILGVLDRMGDLNVLQARQYMSIGVADIDEAKVLGIAIGAPVGMIKRIVIDTAGVAIALVSITYPGALVKLEMSVSKPLN